MDIELTKHTIEEDTVGRFLAMLKIREKSCATIDKYMRDVRHFRRWLAPEVEFDKNRVIQYKNDLRKEYRISSTNSKLSALNTFFEYMGWEDCRVSILKVQRASFRSAQRNLSRQEYLRLLRAAGERGKDQLLHIMETIATTGIRVGELPCITVESLETRRAVVTNKGKTREVLLPLPLCLELREWCRRQGIRSGAVFVTGTGRPVNRSSILRGMKALAGPAGVAQSKIYPHNLRHLFALNYYEKEKDIVRLADLLGHANINTTRIYTMTTSEEELGVLDQMGAELMLPAKSRPAKEDKSEYMKEYV